MTIRLADSASTIQYAPPRNFDVESFTGSGERARRLLGWTPRMSLEAGLGKLIAEFQDSLVAPATRKAAP